MVPNMTEIRVDIPEKKIRNASSLLTDSVVDSLKTHQCFSHTHPIQTWLLMQAAPTYFYLLLHSAYHASLALSSSKLTLPHQIRNWNINDLVVDVVDSYIKPWMKRGYAFCSIITMTIFHQHWNLMRTNLLIFIKNWKGHATIFITD